MRLKSNIVVTILFALPIIVGALFLMPENLPRAFFVALAMLAFILVALRKSFLFSAVVMLVLVLPFNVTFQIPHSSLNYNEFVAGVAVNYLVPTVSIVDVFLLAVGFGVLLKLGREFIAKGFRNNSLVGLILLGLYFVVQSMIVQDWANLIMNARYFVIIAIAVFIIVYRVYIAKEIRELIISLKVIGQSKNKKWSPKLFLSRISLTILNILALIQGIIGIQQFQNGSSVGLSFIGEPSVASGLPYVSSVELAGNEYLRAYGTFPHPNILASYILMVLTFNMIGFVIIERSISTFKMLLWLAFMLVLSILMIFTFARVNILIMLFQWIVFFIVLLLVRRKPSEIKQDIVDLKVSKFDKYKKIANKNRQTLTIQSRSNKLLSVNPLPFSLLIERFLNLLTRVEESLTDRLQLNIVAVDLISKTPLGVGSAQFIRNIADTPITTSGGFLLLQPVHNALLLLFVEQGVIFGGLLLITCAYLLFRAVAEVNNIGKILIISVVASIIAQSMFDHYFLTLPQGMIILLLNIFAIVIIRTVWGDKKKR